MAQNNEKKKRNWLKVIMIPVLLIIGIFIGIFIGVNMLSGEADSAPLIDFSRNNEPVEVRIPLEEFLVNIAPDSNSRNPIVRMDLTLSSLEEEAEIVIEEDIAKIREAVIHVISTHTPESLFEETENGEFVIKSTIKGRINQALDKEIIEEVFITDIIMQN